MAEWEKHRGWIVAQKAVEFCTQWNTVYGISIPYIDRKTVLSPCSVHKVRKEIVYVRTLHVPLGRVIQFREGEGVSVRTSSSDGEVSLA